MYADIPMIKKMLLPAIIIVAGFLAGVIFEKLILRKIKKLSSKTNWESNEIFINALHGTTTILFLVASISLALESTELSPHILNLIHKVLLVLVIFFVTVVLSKISVGFVNVYSKKVDGAFTSTSIFTNITRILVFVIGILIIFQYLGISTVHILTVLGVGGLAVALALQDTLSNLFAGIQVLASGQLKPGHYLRLTSGEEGHITDITWRYTTIISLQNNTVIVPNSKLASAIVTDFSIPGEVISTSIEVGVSYDSDLEKVEKVTTEVAREVLKETGAGVPEFEPSVTYKKFGDSGINMDVNFRVKKFVDQYTVKHEFIKRLHKRYREEGIEIPFPVRTVYIKDKI
ncbi:MAG: mechanosensitive ion channel family protein [Smithella sp.]